MEQEAVDMRIAVLQVRTARTLLAMLMSPPTMPPPPPPRAHALSLCHNALKLRPTLFCIDHPYGSQQLTGPSMPAPPMTPAKYRVDLLILWCGAVCLSI